MTSDRTLYLVQLLEEQVQLYRTLNESAKRKEKVLSLADVEALDEIITAEQALILKAAELEKRRFAAQKDLAAAWGLPIDQVTLEVISMRAEQEVTIRCQRAGKELATILSELKERNDRCQAIIKGALDLVQRTLEKTGTGPTLVDRRV